MEPPVNPLSRHAKNVHSQFGEDGILEAIFSTLGVERGMCVEFGAWDGIYLSNTYNLISNKGWGGVLIEGDSKRAEVLKANMRRFKDVHCVNRFITFGPPSNLDAILATTPLPKDFNLLSIDIDGNDYHIWKSLKNYRPQVVIIEYNQTIPNHVVFVQPSDFAVNQGSSLRAFVELGKEKGYELVATTTTNAIFVLAELFPKFGITDNRPDVMRTDTEHLTYLYQLYDGTLKLAGCDRMVWSGVEMREGRIQMVPAPLRDLVAIPAQKSWFYKISFSIWLRIYRLLYAKVVG